MTSRTNPNPQADLFDHVVQSFMEAPDGRLSNGELYKAVADRAGLPDDTLRASTPVGSSGQRHNLTKRAIRWHQQSLKSMKVLERDPDQRGIWRLAQAPVKGLHQCLPQTRLVAFSTDLGAAVWARCESVLGGLDVPISLCVTSPPYPLRTPRAYGNSDEAAYVDFLCRALEPVVNHLAPGGSICLNLGNDIFEAGSPARSLYRERLVLALNDRFGLFKMDEIVWCNPSKPPGPIQWASNKRCQLNVAWEPIYWFTNDPSRVNADNRRVLEAHTKKHMALMLRGGEDREQSYGDGAYRIGAGSFGARTEGRIARNVLTRGHSCADTRQYRRDAAALGLPVHGAMFPLSIPDFLIRFLTRAGELVVDPFGGTAKSGMAAERLGRRWLVIEQMVEYLRGGAERFRSYPGFAMHREMELWRGVYTR